MYLPPSNLLNKSMCNINISRCRVAGYMCNEGIDLACLGDRVTGCAEFNNPVIPATGRGYSDVFSRIPGTSNIDILEVHMLNNSRMAMFIYASMCLQSILGHKVRQ